MLKEQYLAATVAQVTAVAEQAAAIEEAARLIADSLVGGGAVHLFDTGHLVSHELVNRAGGLAAFRPLRYELRVENPVAGRSPAGAAPAALAAAILGASAVRAGDVLLVGSVSGRDGLLVELVLTARRLGVKVVAVTSRAQSEPLTSGHPSGLRLFEAADLVLDNGAPPGDAWLAVDGIPTRVCPASGVGAAVVLWALVAEVVEQLAARGTPPQVFRSANLPDGPEFNRHVEEVYARRGY